MSERANHVMSETHRGAGRSLLAVALLAVTLTLAPSLGGRAGAAPATAPPAPPSDVGIPDLVPPPDAGSTLIPCDQADQRLELTVDTHLDPSCAYTAGFEITASDVTLDCQGAQVSKTGGSAVLLVHTPIDVDLTGVTIRYCDLAGGTNNIKVTRDGFRTLAEGVEFEHTLRDVVLEHNEIGPSGGVGIFVDGYVEHVTIRNTSVMGTGSSGIYLDGGSRRNTISDNVIHDNGFIENGSLPEGHIETFGGLRFRWWGTGREGLSIDGSSENVVTGNHFEGNDAGGIFLYTNCGEFVNRNPERWYDRRTPSDDNLIEGNTLVGGIHGVWVGSRMGENTLPMDCSKPAYATKPFQRYVLDTAADNTIRGNTFVDITYGVQAEDDGTVVEGNTFAGPDDGHHAVVIGTRVRTDALGRPVAGTVLRDNASTIVGNTHPFRWVHGHDGTVVEGNTAMRRPTELCEGAELPHNPFMFVVKAVPEPEGSPPTPKPDYEIPVLGPLPSCGALPAVVPEAPLAVTGAGLPGGARVDWEPPADDGGSPVVGYDVLDELDQVVASTSPTVTRADVIGLIGGTTPAYRVVARNAVGDSVPSASTGPVPVGAGATFLDVPEGSTFADVISWAQAMGVARGDAGRFHPTGATTRQALAAFLYNLAGRPEIVLPDEATFTDVPLDHPFAVPVEWAAAQGIATGRLDGTFGPTEPTTRRALALLLHGAAGRPPVPVPALPVPAVEQPVFADVPFDDVGYLATAWAAAVGIADGYDDGTFRPDRVVSRQAAVAMLFRSTRQVDLTSIAPAA